MAAPAYLVDEEQVWKCPKHPSRKRRNGICPACLRDRLTSLCPHCAKVRPCPCLYNSASSSASSSASFSRAGESSLRRSRSVAIPFLRRSNTARTPSFLSFLTRSKTNRNGTVEHQKDEELNDGDNRIEDFARMITRSRSVTAATTAKVGFRRGETSSTPSKGRFWNFSIPMKIFRSKSNGEDHSLNFLPSTQ